MLRNRLILAASLPLLAVGCLVIVVSGPGGSSLDAGLEPVDLPDGGVGYRLPDGGITTTLVEAICQVNPTSGTPGVTVFTFDGSNSLGSPGTEIEFYEWSFGDGTGSQGSPEPQHVYADAGTFTATLTATDTSGASGSTTCQTVTLTP